MFDAIKVLIGIKEKTYPVAYEVSMEIADKIIAEAKRICPIDTGQLRSSIQIYDENTAKATVQLAANTSYAAFVEWGTSRMKAQPYMRPAVQKFSPRWAGHYVKKIRRLQK